jgi:hypothetical protein
MFYGLLRAIKMSMFSGCFASNENLHRSSPAASDRSFHSGSQTESGIHLTNDDEVSNVKFMQDTAEFYTLGQHTLNRLSLKNFNKIDCPFFAKY